MESVALVLLLASTVIAQPVYPPPFSAECYVSPNGNDYRGFQNHTYSGLTCQAWDSQSPPHSITPEAYPDAGLDGNFCRNPDNSDFVWCYVSDPKIRWQTCNLAPAQQYCTPPPCVAATTCNNQGFCLSDQSCSCYPQYYGTACDKVITTNGLTDGGLAGVIVGWLLAVPVLACISFILYQMHQSGYFDGCYDSCGGWKDSVANLSCWTCCSRQNKGGGGQEAVEMRVASPPPSEAKRSEEPAPKPDSGAGSMSGTNTTAEPPKSSVPDPPDADVMVQQVVDIMQGNIDKEKARKALRDNGWAMETALTQLLA